MGDFRILLKKNAHGSVLGRKLGAENRAYDAYPPTLITAPEKENAL